MSSTYPEGDPFAYAVGEWQPDPPQWDDAAQVFDGAPEPEGDPFDQPLYDPATGEVLDPEPTTFAGLPVVTSTQVPPDTFLLTTAEHAAAITALDALPQHMADDTAQAVAFPERGELQAFAGNLSRALDDRVNALYNAAQQRRPAGPTTQASLAGEVTTLAAISDLGKTLGEVFTRMDKGARSLLADVLGELPRAAEVEKHGGSMSVRVGVRPGEDVKATITQPTEVFTDTAGIVDALVPHLIAVSADRGGLSEVTEGIGTATAAYASGARAMAAALLGLDGGLGLLASPKWKSTALDALRADLERSAEPGLAGRLDAAYGRRPVGNVQTKVERVEPTKRGGPRTIDGRA